MKKVMALVLLVAATAQANELKQSWNNFGKDNRAISGGKALVAGYLSYASARQVYEQWKTCSWVYKENHGLFDVEKDSYDNYGSMKAEILPRQGVLAGLYGCAACLFLKQAWHDARHALGKNKKEEMISSLVNGLKKGWHNFGKDNREVSGGKALLAGGFGYAAFRKLFLDGLFLGRLVFGGWKEVLTQSEKYPSLRESEQKKIIKGLPRKVFMMGIYAGASYFAFKQAWHDAKHALGEDEKEEQVS